MSCFLSPSSYRYSSSYRLAEEKAEGALQADGGRWLGMVTELRRVVQPLRVFKAHEVACSVKFCPK